MIRLPRYSVWLVAVMFAAPGAAAQPSQSWQACRQQPTRACLFAESIEHARDDAPARDVPRFTIWQSNLHERLARIAEAKKDRALFAEARRLAATPATPGASRDAALRMVAQAQARAGFTDDATETVATAGDPGAVPREIVVFLATTGRVDEALVVLERISSPSSRADARIRLARVTHNIRQLDRVWRDIRQIEDSYTQSSITRDLAVAQAALGQVDQALTAIEGIGVRAHQAYALAELARLLRNPDYLAAAKKYAAGLQDAEPETFQILVRADIALGRLEDAQATLEGPDFEARPDALADSTGELAAAYWLRDGRQKAEIVLDKVLAHYAEHFWSPARYALVRGLADAGRFDSALLMAFVNEPAMVDRALGYVAIRRAEAGAFNGAVDTADKIKDPDVRSPALARIAALLPE
jgi:hypothetical protein